MESHPIFNLYLSLFCSPWEELSRKLKLLRVPFEILFSLSPHISQVMTSLARELELSLVPNSLPSALAISPPAG